MTNQFSAPVKSTLALWVNCAKEAASDFRRNLLLTAGAAALFVVWILSLLLFSRFGLAGGVLLGFISAALLSLYYSWLALVAAKIRLTPGNLVEFNMGMFLSVINTGFILWLAQWVVDMLTSGLHLPWAAPGLSLVLVVVFNSLPESIYLERSEGLAAFSESGTFIQSNFLTWFPPFLLLMLPVLLVSPGSIPVYLAQSNPLLPVTPIAASLSVLLPGLGQIVAGLLAVLIINWFMLFRARLFGALSSGNLRLMAFKSKF